jgi:hypothetical protein
MSVAGSNRASARAALYEASTALNHALNLMHQLDAGADERTKASAGIRLPGAVAQVRALVTGACEALEHANLPTTMPPELVKPPAAPTAVPSVGACPLCGVFACRAHGAENLR